MNCLLLASFSLLFRVSVYKNVYHVLTPTIYPFSEPKNRTKENANPPAIHPSHAHSPQVSSTSIPYGSLSSLLIFHVSFSQVHQVAPSSTLLPAVITISTLNLVSVLVTSTPIPTLLMHDGSKNLFSAGFGRSARSGRGARDGRRVWETGDEGHAVGCTGWS
jgi:hypothetical protein